MKISQMRSVRVSGAGRAGMDGLAQVVHAGLKLKALVPPLSVGLERRCCVQAVACPCSVPCTAAAQRPIHSTSRLPCRQWQPCGSTRASGDRRGGGALLLLQLQHQDGPNEMASVFRYFGWSVCDFAGCSLKWHRTVTYFYILGRK